MKIKSDSGNSAVHSDLYSHEDYATVLRYAGVEDPGRHGGGTGVGYDWAFALSQEKLHTLPELRLFERVPV